MDNDYIKSIAMVSEGEDYGEDWDVINESRGLLRAKSNSEIKDREFWNKVAEDSYYENIRKLEARLKLSNNDELSDEELYERVQRDNEKFAKSRAGSIPLVDNNAI